MFHLDLRRPAETVLYILFVRNNARRSNVKDLHVKIIKINLLLTGSTCVCVCVCMFVYVLEERLGCGCW